jgi:hypothetical protein
MKNHSCVIIEDKTGQGNPNSWRDQVGKVNIGDLIKPYAFLRERMGEKELSPGQILEKEALENLLISRALKGWSRFRASLSHSSSTRASNHTAPFSTSLSSESRQLLAFFI